MCHSNRTVFLFPRYENPANKRSPKSVTRKKTLLREWCGFNPFRPWNVHCITFWICCTCAKPKGKKTAYRTLLWRGPGKTRLVATLFSSGPAYMLPPKEAGGGWRCQLLASFNCKKYTRSDPQPLGCGHANAPREATWGWGAPFTRTSSRRARESDMAVSRPHRGRVGMDHASMCLSWRCLTRD
jgi:hypothetical protein